MCLLNSSTYSSKYILEVPEYIDNLLKITWKLHARVFRAQKNLNNIMDEMYTWAMMPVIYRKDARDENLLSVADKDDRFAERFAEIEATAEELEHVLKENYKLFFDLLPDHVYNKEELELLDGNRSIIFVFYCGNLLTKRFINFLKALFIQCNYL